MRNLGSLGFLAATILAAAWPAASQMSFRTPDFRGVFSPVVGSGAAYQMQTPQGNSEMEITVVGKEDVAGKTGYWMEMAMNAPRGAGQMYVKDLMVIDGATTTINRMIMQMAGQPPMDMTSMMSRAGATASASQSIDSRAAADKLGSESVTTPAGTFNCDHYKAKDGSWEAWISTQISPWGLVKSTGSNTTMTLTRTITNATDHITGTPQQFNFPGMPGGAGGPPQR